MSTIDVQPALHEPVTESRDPSSAYQEQQPHPPNNTKDVNTDS